MALAYLLMVERGLGGAANVMLLLLGPPAFYSVARVLRPYPPGGERTVRHWAASISAAYSLYGFTIITSEGLSLEAAAFGVLLAVIAAPGGLLTLVWGAIAVVVRLVRRRP